MKTKILYGSLLAFSALLFPARAGAQQESSNLPDEYLKNLKNYEFVNTRGMKDLAPNRHSWLPGGLDDSDNWEFPTDDEIKTLKEMGINFPDFSFITGSDTVAPGQKRQRTHTVEHVLYALPGDALSLYPYYGLEKTFNFFETFSHWYDYRNGGRVIHKGSDGKNYDLLDFPSCRDHIQVSDDYGFYGGIYMSPGTKEVPSPVTLTVYEVSTPEEYIKAVDAINLAGGNCRLDLKADLDFSGLNNVPMLGDRDGSHFGGVFNGNGHTIRNLKIERTDGGAGLIRYTADGAQIYNLVVDSSCSFQAAYAVGLVAKHDGGRLTVRNVVMNATIKGTREGTDDHCTGAILALCDNDGTDNVLIFKDLYIGATIGNPTMTDGSKHNTVLCGWLATGNTHSNSVFTNIVFKGTLVGGEDLKGAKYIRRVTHEKFSWDNCKPQGATYIEKHDNYSILYTGCYGDVEGDEPAWKSTTGYTTFEGWADASTPPVSDIPNPLPVDVGSDLLANGGHRPWHGDANSEDQKRRKAGTSAVFYFPDSNGLADEFLNDRNEYVIAADFSQTFEPQKNLDVDEMQVIEPVVSFRHIFRIRDGRRQAEELFNNNEYTRRHQHKVSVPVNTDFQIRLDSPLPTDWGKSGGVTNYYFKNSDGKYERIRQFGVRVLDGETRRTLDGEQGFRFGTDIEMQRAEPDGDRDRLLSKKSGDYKYHTMLLRDGLADEAHYIVQILAKDNSGNILKGKDDAEMILMEYDIRFMPEEGASLLSESQLYSSDKKYEHARDEYMKKTYGEPMDKIDFDDFFAINQMTGNDDLKKKMISYSVIKHLAENNSEGIHKDFPVWADASKYQGPDNSPGTAGMYHSFYKWPITWSRSGYSFGYNYRYDYNMYMLTTHTENVPYHVQADNWKGNIDGEPGLYDRLYYKTRRLNAADPRIGIEQGYFYYVNAASDPGVSARLNFNIPCPGSRVIVSAWVAECSPVNKDNGDEPANIAFNFVAVMKGSGERITLHNFITGYLPLNKLGEWLNVYYSFVPRLAEFSNNGLSFDQVDHYELELAHNGTSSAGSDYAIDDIRAYVVPPVGEADHFGYACDDTDLDLRVETSFDTLLEKSGEYEAFGDSEGQELKLYYAFVDKEKYDANPKGDFSKYVVKVGSDDKTYSSLTLQSNYTKHDEYSYDEKKYKTDADYRDKKNKYDTAYRMTENGDRLIVFDTQAEAGKLRVGKEYYVVFKSAPEGEVPEDLATFFDLNGECSYNCVMIVKPSLKIKFDGEVQEEFANLAVCENQWPVIQANVWSIDTEKTPVEVDKNAYFDWFDGSMNDFENYRFANYPSDLTVTMTDPETGNAERKQNHLKYALSVFRQHYWEAENVTDVKYMTDMAEEENLPDVPALEQWMLDIIDTACQADATGRKRLLLHNTAFVLSPKDIEEGKSKDKVRVVAIPIVDLYPENNPSYPGEGYSVCPSPTEIGVTIAHRTPILKHGLTDAKVNYPSNLNDVPLRVGLNQSKPGNGFVLRRINMPVRETASSDGSARKFQLFNDTVLNKENLKINKIGALVLAQTNDPEYKDLGSIVMKDGKETDSDNILWVGEITEFNAEAREESSAGGFENYVAQLYDDIRLKEGYFYRFRFRFEEVHEEEIDADAETVCQGQDVFTIKVVPEYMEWTGDKNLSWDNDDNWRRVASGEILKTDAASGNAFFTDGASANRRSYAPLPFTKTIVDAPSVNEDEAIEGETPWLYAPKTAGKVKDDYTAGKSNDWTSDPLYATATTDMAAVGAPTSLIQFDMTGFVAGEGNSAELRCQPWTGNNCAEIHFLPGATVMGQQNLNYGRAWVDVELDHSRWYLLSTPLKDIYAGDFYLPTAKARQETELFQEIRYDENLNNRFAPAVYQRGWDKATASVYEYGKTGARSAAVRTFWSHVYNDVAEKYGEGNAFSIKADVSKASSPEEKVLFRLPKADTEYLYYSVDGNRNGHKTTLEKENVYKLNETSGTLSCSTANAGRYFLVGNPFMTHFDIRKFLEKNAATLSQKYWLVTEQGLIAGSLSDAGSFVAVPYPADDIPADPSVIAPMQGFFVETKEDASSIELDYDETMMRRYDSSGAVLTETTRAGNAQLRIISLNAGRPSSSALLVTGEENREASADAFDLRDLGIASTVFTARGGRACSINLCEDAEGVEIGVIADDDTETTLLFEGAENFSGLLLLDREADTLVPLAEASGLKVKGTAAGRFFLTSGLEEDIATDALGWHTDGQTLTVTDRAATGSLSVTLCDILGRVVADLSTDAASLTVEPGNGVFVVKMANANEEKTIKLSL